MPRHLQVAPACGGDLEGLKVHHALKQQRYCFDAIALGAHATLPYEFLGVTA